jgi:methyl-accepting chemotaxis protein
MEASTRWSRIVTLIGGGGVAALGLAVVVGWHTYALAILQPRPGLIAPVYNTGLSFLLCGVGLAAIALNRPALALPCGAIASLLGLLNLVQHAFGVDLAIDQLLVEHFITTQTRHPGRMAPNTGVCFVLAGIALVLEAIPAPALARRRPPIVGLMGSVVSALGAVALSGYLLGVKTYGWGSFLPMSPQTAGGFATLGVGVMAAAWREGRTDPDARAAPHWLPIPAGVAAVTATLCLWQPLVAQEHAQIERTVEAELAGAKNAIVADLEARVFPLLSMARRWEESGAPARAAWEREAGLVVGRFAEFQAVEWVDPTRHVRWVVPAEGNEAERDRDLASEPERLGLLREAEAGGRGRGGHDVRLRDTSASAWESPLLLAAVPISADAAGSILGVIRLQELFAASLTREVAPVSAITVSNGAGELELFDRDADDRQLAEEWGREGVVAAHGVSWRVRVWPQAEQLARSRSAVPQAVMAVGGLIALVLGWAVHVAQVSRLRALEVESINRRLGGEVAERAQAEQSLRTTTADLHRTLDAIRGAVALLAATSTELLASVSEQAAGLQEQVAAVAETVATVDQVAESSEQAAQGAGRVGEAIQRTLEIGRSGRQAVADSSTALEHVKELVESTAADILMLAGRAQDIGAIVATVSDIAETTNLLALNAAIEASRAGVHGAGFAVVAREVKVLADQSKQATVQVRQILGEIQRATETSVLSTEQVTKGVAAAIRVEGQAAEAIRTLAVALSETAQAVTRIVASSNQQALGMAQVSQAMKSIEQVERQNDLALHQLKQAAQDLATLSTQLATLAGT